MRLRGVLFWMSRFLSCHRDGGRFGRTMDLYCDRPRGGLTVIKRETPTDPGRRVVTRISDKYEPRFPVVCDDIPYPAVRDVVAARVGAVRPSSSSSKFIHSTQIKTQPKASDCGNPCSHQAVFPWDPYNTKQQK